jgi:arsenite/tail-anchored protein-transporting ATPase
MRLLIFTGTAQLNRSAAALATACAAARAGQRVLIASMGPLHTLGALLNRQLGPRPLEIEPNLAAMEIAAIDEAGERWDNVRPGMRSGLAARLKDIGSEEIPSFPGLDAVGTILVADKAAQAGRFDLLVIDGPAPDGLIRALSLPDLLRWMLRLVFGLDRGLGRSRTSQEAAMIPAALIGPTAIAPLQDLRVVLEQQRTRLEGASGTRVRLVLAGSELGLSSTRDALIGMGLYGLELDRLIVDTAQGAADAAAQQAFSSGPNRPALLVNALDSSVTSVEGWATRGEALYGTEGYAPAAGGRTVSGEREIKLHVPFIDPKALDVAMASEELVLRLGQFRRHLLLPALAAGGKLRARVDGEILRVWVE